MRKLIDIINECRYDMITESLKSGWLQKLMSAIKDKGIKNKSMKSLSDYDQMIRWDKVTDYYCKTYDAGDSTALKIARKFAKREMNGLIILLKDDNIVGTITPGGFVSFINKVYWSEEWALNRFTYTKQYEVVDFVKRYASVIYTFDSEHDPENVIINPNDSDSRITRGKARYGMVLQGDAECYRELARKNVDRYKEIIAKNKVKNLDNNLGKQIKEVVDKVLDITIDMETNPDKYKTSSFKVSTLVDMIYSTTGYDTKRNRVTGSNGILKLWKSYLHDKNAVIDNTRFAHMYYKNAKSAREAIEILLTKINEIIDSL